MLQTLEHPNVVVYIDVFLHQDTANNGLQVMETPKPEPLNPKT